MLFEIAVDYKKSITAEQKIAVKVNLGRTAFSMYQRDTQHFPKEKCFKTSSIMFSEGTSMCVENGLLPVHVLIKCQGKIPSEGVPNVNKVSANKTHLLRMFDEELFPDVIIESATGSFKAHRSMLARSPVLEQMLMESMLEGQISIKDVKHEVLVEMIRFLYCGEVRKMDKLMTDLLAAAEKFQIESLKFKIIKLNSVRGINRENFVEILSAADFLNDEALKKKVKDFIMR